MILTAPSDKGQCLSTFSVKTGNLKNLCIVWPFMLKAAIPVGARTATEHSCSFGLE